MFEKFSRNRTQRVLTRGKLFVWLAVGFFTFAANALGNNYQINFIIYLIIGVALIGAYFRDVRFLKNQSQEVIEEAQSTLLEESQARSQAKVEFKSKLDQQRLAKYQANAEIKNSIELGTLESGERILTRRFGDYEVSLYENVYVCVVNKLRFKTVGYPVKLIGLETSSTMVQASRPAYGRSVGMLTIRTPSEIFTLSSSHSPSSNKFGRDLASLQQIEMVAKQLLSK